MNITQVCEGCGEEFITRHSAPLCLDCDTGHVKLHTKPQVAPKQGNERNREAKQRERNKRRRRVYKGNA